MKSTSLVKKRGCDSGLKKGVRFWLEKGGAREEGLKRINVLFECFLHHVGKRESALFFLLASVFPTGFFTAEVLMRSTRFNGIVLI